MRVSSERTLNEERLLLNNLLRRIEKCSVRALGKNTPRDAANVEGHF